MSSIRVCLAGTWDPDFHRNRTLMRLLKRAGCEVAICQVDLWGERGDGIVRKRKLAVLLRALVAYPLLAWRFIRTPRCDLVIVPYPGHLDMILLAPLCRLRRVPIILDIFISLFDTIVSDRGLVHRNSPIGIGSRLADRVACRLADMILADTPPHAVYFSQLSGVSIARFRVLWLGAQEKIFRPDATITPDPRLVVFHGTFIRLQGLETVVRAAKELESDGIRVRIIGDGQERNRVDQLIADLEVNNIERTGLLPLSEVPKEIANAGICLGIFGTTAKAARVIPNKLYECLAVRRPVVTGDTAAIRSGFTCDEVVTVPPGDAQALAAAVRWLSHDDDAREQLAAAGHERFMQDYSEEPLTRQLSRYIYELIATGHRYS